MKYTIITTILAAFLLSPASFAVPDTTKYKGDGTYKYGDHKEKIKTDVKVKKKEIE